MSRPTHEAPAEAPLASLARHSLVYSIAPILQRFIALLLVRLYTGRIDKAQYGALANCDLLFTALVQISGTNLLAAVVRLYFEQRDERDRRAVISSAIVFLSAVSCTLVAIGILFRDALADFLFVTTDPGLAGDNLSACVVIVLATIPLALCSEASFRYLQIGQRSRLVTTLRVSKSTLEMALKVLFLVGFEYGVIGFLLATLVGEIVTNLLLTGWVLSRIGLAFSWRVLSPMLRYAAPLIPVGLCQMVLNVADRLMLRHFGPQDEAIGWVGVYSHGYQIGWLVQLVVVGSFMQIWQPWIFGVRDPERRAELVRRVSTWALFAVGLASVALTLFGREFVWLLSGQAEYREAFRVVPWVSAGYVFFALNALSQVPMFIARRTWPMLWLNLAAAVVNLALNLLLIPRYGIVGAAVATFATFVPLGILGHVLAGKLVGARFEHGRMAAMLALVVAAMIAALWIDASFSQSYANTLTPMTAVKTGLFSVAASIVWAVLLTSEERGRCAGWIRERLAR